MLESAFVGLIVVAAAVYAVWALTPALSRNRFAARLAHGLGVRRGQLAVRQGLQIVLVDGMRCAVVHGRASDHFSRRRAGGWPGAWLDSMSSRRRARARARRDITVPTGICSTRAASA